MAALLIFALLAACEKQQYNDEADFTVIPTGEHTIIIQGYIGEKTAVSIPPRIQSMPVAEIMEDAFSGYWKENRLVSLSIPNTVTVIGKSAFANNRLTELRLGRGVAIIEENAFAYNQLTSLAIPNSVTYIGEVAFMENQLRRVAIGSGVASIEGGVFMLNEITSVTLGRNVEFIGHSAFAFNQLASISIPASVSVIEMFAFNDNPLTRITIGENVDLGRFNPLTNEHEAAFPLEFDAFYFSQGRKAGTYTYTNGAWSVR